MTGSSDLTQGSIGKKLLLYAAPLVLSNLLQALYNMVDMIVAGQLIHEAAISAISNAGLVTHMLTNIIIGLCTGGNILIGQYFGAKERQSGREASVTLFSSGMLLGLVLAGLLAALARPIMAVLGAPALEDSAVYLRICAAGFPFIMGYNICAACLRAVGNSRAPMICIACTALSNMVLDILFVGPLGWGIAGAAWATVLSQAASFLVALVFVLRGQELFGLRLDRLYIRRDKLKTILRLGLPCAVQMSVTSISWLSVTYLINAYGVAVSAASGVAARIKDFCQLFIVAMTNAASGMIAQCIGARDYDRARKVLYTAMAATVAIALVLIALVECFAPAVVRLFSGDSETVFWAVRNLRIEILGQVFYAIFLVYHALALGAGDTWCVLLSSFVNCILVRIWLAIAFNALWGATGIFWACMIAPFSSVPVGIWYERSGRWRKTLIQSERR